MKRPLQVFNTVISCLLVLLALCLVPRALAMDWDVSITDAAFDPDYLDIEVGDTVWWTNDDDFGDPHTSTSDQGSWDTGIIPFGFEISVTFGFAGTFPYHDTEVGFTGTIVVTQPPPPQPLITNLATLPNGSFKFTVTNVVVGKTNIIQASTNLVNWTNLYTNIASSTGFIYTDTAAPNFKRQRLYRVRVL